MLSNVGLDTMKNFIDDDEQKNLFDALFLSSDETIVKPDPRAFEIIAESLGVETHE